MVHCIFDKAKECERKAQRTEQIIKEKPKKISQKKKDQRRQNGLRNIGGL